MEACAERRTMAKAKPEPKRNDVTVKVDADVVATAKMVAASREMTLAEYLSSTLAPIVQRDLESEYARRAGPGKGSKK